MQIGQEEQPRGQRVTEMTRSTLGIASYTLAVPPARVVRGKVHADQTEKGALQAPRSIRIVGPAKGLGDEPSPDPQPRQPRKAMDI